MRVYSTEKGRAVCNEIINSGYVWAMNYLCLTGDELDCMRVMNDPLFGAEKLRGDEVAESDHPTWRKLAKLGYVEVDEE